MHIARPYYPGRWTSKSGRWLSALAMVPGLNLSLSLCTWHVFLRVFARVSSCRSCRNVHFFPCAANSNMQNEWNRTLVVFQANGIWFFRRLSACLGKCKLKREATRSVSVAREPLKQIIVGEEKQTEEEEGISKWEAFWREGVERKQTYTVFPFLGWA